MTELGRKRFAAGWGRRFLLFTAVLHLFWAGTAMAQPEGMSRAPADEREGLRIVRGLLGEGQCVVANLTPEQARIIALRGARVDAISKAGVYIRARSTILNGEMANEAIKEYTSGLIVFEEVLGKEYVIKPADTPKGDPTIEYHVRIRADVGVPARRSRPLQLAAELKDKGKVVRVFRKGDRAHIDMRTEREASVAVFNITADDRVVMLFPNPHEKNVRTKPSETLRFPPDGAKVDLVMEPLPGHQKDYEAFLVVALETPADGKDFNFGFLFGEKPLPVAEFFKRYSKIAPEATDEILPYEVHGNE